MSKIPSRQTLAGIGGNPLYVPMDGDGNASISGNLKVGENVSIVNDLTVSNMITTGNISTGSAQVAVDALVGGSLVVEGNEILNGNLSVDGSLIVGENLTVTGAFITDAVTTTGGNITCNDPGFLIGNGQGLTNLPPSNIGLTPSFYFQSALDGFYVEPNRFLPEAEPAVVPTIGVAIPCELYGKPPGLYYWKTDSSIYFQNLFSSGSGVIYWDGAKVSGETTYSLTQNTSVLNPLYSLTESYLFSTSLTGFYVAIESTFGAVSIDQPYDYYVNFYKLADLGGSAQPLPTPTGVAVSDVTATNATVSWNQVAGYKYALYLTNLDTLAINAYAVGMVGTITFSTLSPPVVLTPGTNYSVQIQATYLVGSVTQVSERTTPVTFITST